MGGRVTFSLGAHEAMTIHRNAQIAAIAGRQHGLITTAQLVGAGLSRSGVRRRLQNGSLHTVRRGVHSMSSGPMSREAEWLAPLLSLGDDAVVGYFGAIILLGHWKWPLAGNLDVITRCLHRHSMTDVCVHHSAGLLRRDWTRRERIRITSLPRTLLDLGERLSAWRLTNVMHEAARRNALPVKRINDVADRNRGRAAVTVLRHALRLHLAGSAGTMSDLEDQFLALVMAAGLPEPLVNHRYTRPDGTSIRPDLWWPEHALVAEVDGSPHGRFATKIDDKHRDNDFASDGIHVVRAVPDQFGSAIDELRRRITQPARSHQFGLWERAK